MPKLHNQNQVFWLPLATFNENIYKKDKESLNSLREKMVKSGETLELKSDLVFIHCITCPHLRNITT